MDAAATPRPDPAAERAARMNLGLERLMIPVVIALGVLLASFAVRNSEYWRHLAIGRLIVAGDYSFGKDPFSFDTEDRVWVNHSWLFDLALYGVHALGKDGSAVVYVKAGLMGLLALALLLACRPSPDEQIIPGTKANPRGWVTAIAVCLALIAAAPRFELEPTLISYLLFGVTLMVLLRSRWWPAKVLTIVLPVLFALWVNIDNWFFLGPVLVAVFLIGELIQRFLPGGEKVEPGRLKLLTLVLLVGLAACLLNPHHVRAFTVLPFELKPNIVEAMQNDPGWRARVANTTDIVYRTQPNLGPSVAGICYYALLLLGVGSFILNYQRIRVPLLLAWLGTAALTMLINWRLIPFFAIVSAPAIALNVHSFFYRRPYRRDVTFDPNPATQPSAPASEATTGASEAWWPGATDAAAAPAVAPSAPPASATTTTGGDMSVTPETMLAMMGVMGRLLTVVAGLVLLAMTYPGWLHAGSRTDKRPRRLAWTVEPEPAFVEVAEQLDRWQKDGRLASDARGLALHLDIPAYCAWYAPGVKMILDHRFALLGDRSDDYMKVKRGLSQWAAGAENPVDFAEVLRKHRISYVIPTQDEHAGGYELIGRMLIDSRQWALWFQNGNCAIFGWHDPKTPRRPDPTRLDLIAVAFGAQASRLPSGDAFAVTRYPMPNTVSDRGLIDKFLSPPPPPPPPSTLAAYLYVQMRNQALENARIQSQQALFLASFAGQVGLLNQPANLLAFDRPIPERLGVVVTQMMAAANPLPAAISVLAVREARRGVLAHPNEGFPHLILGLTYGTLPTTGGSALQSVSQMVALHQGLARLTPEQTEGEFARDITGAWKLLHELHLSRQELDLAEEAMSRVMARYERYPLALGREADQKQIFEHLQREHEKLRNELLARRDSFLVEEEEMVKRNAPALEIAVRARSRFGLVRDALRVLEAVSDQLDLPSSRMLADLYLTTGQAEEAQRVLDLLPAQLQDSFELLSLRINVLAALGEYARAGQLMEKLIANIERAEDPKQPFVTAAFVFQSLHFSCVEPVAQVARLATTQQGLQMYLGTAAQLAGQRSEKAELLAARAMLALEEGDLSTAQQYLDRSLAVGARFNSESAARAYRRVLEQQAKK